MDADLREMGAGLPSATIDIGSWRDQKEQTAAIIMWIFAVVTMLVILALFNVMLLFWLPLIWIIKRISQCFILAYFKTNALLVSRDQFPEIDAMVENFSQRLGIPRPDVYIIQEGIWNAFAAKLAGKKIVVLFSGAIDSIIEGGELEDVGFVVAHELSHIAAGHLNFSASLMRLGGWFVWVALWHSRRAELTCDRLALACCGRTEPVLRALANMTAGARLAGNVNLEAVKQQWYKYKGEFFVGYRTLYSTHPHKLCRIVETIDLAKQRGMN